MKNWNDKALKMRISYEIKIYAFESRKSKFTLFSTKKNTQTIACKTFEDILNFEI